MQLSLGSYISSLLLEISFPQGIEFLKQSHFHFFQFLLISSSCSPGGVSHGCHADSSRATGETVAETGLPEQGSCLCQTNQEGKKGITVLVSCCLYQCMYTYMYMYMCMYVCTSVYNVIGSTSTFFLLESKIRKF